MRRVSRNARIFLFGIPFLLAPLLALLIQALREPDHLAPTAPPSGQRPFAPLVAAALSSPQASALELSLAEVQAHLSQALLPARNASGPWSLQRVGLRLAPGRCEVLTLQQWRGWNVHLNVTYQVSLAGGKLRLQPLAGHLGRLALGPFWLARFEKPLERLVPFLRKERVLMDRLSELKIEPDRLVLRVRVSAGASTEPTTPAPAAPSSTTVPARTPVPSPAPAPGTGAPPGSAPRR